MGNPKSRIVTFSLDERAAVESRRQLTNLPEVKKSF
jgi:hypothetical protein